jgi:hypothetical protein
VEVGVGFKGSESVITAAKICFCRKLVGICRWDHISSEEIREKLLTTCVVDDIQSYQIEQF